MEGGAFFGGLLLGGFLMFLVMASFVGDEYTNNGALVKSGHGEYVIVDQATGRTEFRLKEVK